MDEQTNQRPDKRKALALRVSRCCSKFSRSFSTFSGLFGPVLTHSDTFGYNRMLSANKINRQNLFEKELKKFSRKLREVFRCFCEVLGELGANGPENQLLHLILFKIHLS